MNQMNTLLEDYWHFLRSETTVEKFGQWFEISTPYLDAYNDHIPIYVKFNEDGAIELSDDGETLIELEQSGCAIKGSPRRQSLLTQTLNRFGVTEKDGQLLAQAKAHTFPRMKHNFLQAILCVQDMFYTSSASVATLFFEEVEAWFDARGIGYLPTARYAGKSGFDYEFAFSLPKSPRAPVRLIQLSNHANKPSAQGIILSWKETEGNRPDGSVGMAIVNDTERKIPEDFAHALEQYSIEMLPWSQRNDRLEVFNPYRLPADG